MKLALFVTGTTGSGKTTLIRRLASMGWSTFCTGDLFRAMNRKLSKEESAVAPASFNDTVRHYLSMFMATEFFRPGITLAAIETVPRSIEQVEWLDGFRGQGWTIIVLALDARYEVRVNRVKSRNMTQAQDRTEGDLAKLAEEQHTWRGFLDKLEAVGIDVYHMDTSDWDYVGEAKSGIQGLSSMMQAGINLFNAKTQHRANLTPGRMVSRCMDELKEYWLHGNTGTKEQLISELVDAMWFLLLAFKAHGLGASEVYEHYMKKASINNVRHDHGCKPHTGMEDDHA